MTIEDFTNWAIEQNKLVGLPDFELEKFIDYWTDKPPRKKLMNFERHKTFVMKLRLKTWKRNYERNPTNTGGTSAYELLA